MPFLSWPEMHGALTHLPVAFLLAVPVFEIIAALSRKAEFRVVSFWLVAAAVVTAVPSLLSGWITSRTIFSDGHAPVQFQPHWIAALSTAVLAGVLLMWRMQTREQSSRRALPISIGFSLVIAVLVGYTGYLGGKMVFGGAGESTDRSSATALVPVRGSHKGGAVDSQLVAAGGKLFDQYRCQACHRLNGEGSATGPDLTHEAQRNRDINWHIAHLKDPPKMKPGSSMPPFSDLKPDELKALAAFVASLK